MRRILLGTIVVGGLAAMSVASAQNEQAAPSKDNDPFRAYYGNTYTCYWPDAFYCKHWWNADGTEVFFEARWLPEGIITSQALEGPHSQFVANGQWCSHNARTANARTADDPYEKVDPAITNNNKNGCQPVVDAQPGDHWYKLHLNGGYEDEREQYTLMPGHQ